VLFKKNPKHRSTGVFGVKPLSIFDETTLVPNIGATVAQSHTGF